MSRVLIIHPDFSRLGGIENYYRKIFPHLDIDFESLGNSRRDGEKGLISRLRRIVTDYIHYWNRLSDPDIDIVHINPSLAPKMFYREALYLTLARFRNKKTVVFFHGWDTQFQKKIDRQNGAIFRRLYSRADAFIVLASSFAQKLEQWGICGRVYQEVIVIEDEVLHTINIDKIIDERIHARQWSLLFPSRIMRSKGIMTAIKSLAILQQYSPGSGLVVAGDGEHLQEAKDLARKLEVNNVSFVGIVSGEDKYNIFRKAHILCFPTEHSEGFPNVIVEAMAFGLPVLSRPVGGIPDFFNNGEHGYLTESTDPEVYARYILELINDENLYRHIAHTNNEYARIHFPASKAAARLGQIYRALRDEPSDEAP